MHRVMCENHYRHFKKIMQKWQKTASLFGRTAGGRVSDKIHTIYAPRVTAESILQLLIPGPSKTLMSVHCWDETCFSFRFLVKFVYLRTIFYFFLCDIQCGNTFKWLTEVPYSIVTNQPNCSCRCSASSGLSAILRYLRRLFYYCFSPLESTISASLGIFSQRAHGELNNRTPPSHCQWYIAAKRCVDSSICCQHIAELLNSLIM